MDFVNTIHAIIDPIVEDKEAIIIREVPSTRNKDITILIVAKRHDISKLIGRRGIIASAIREVVSLAVRKPSTHVHIKFESYDESEEEA